MSSVIVFYRQLRPSALISKAFSCLDSGLSLVLIRKNRPIITIRQDLPAPELIEPSDPVSSSVDSDVRSSEQTAASTDAASQEETLSKRSGQHLSSLHRDTVDAETGVRCPGTHIQHPLPVSLSPAKEPISSVMSGPVRSGVSPVHPGDESGNGPDRLITTSGSLNTPPQSPAAQIAEEDCPDEKAVMALELEDCVDKVSESSTHPELSPVSGTTSDTSNITMGNSSGVETTQSESESLTMECGVDQLLSDLPSTQQQPIGEGVDAVKEKPGEIVSLKLPLDALKAASPERQELKVTQHPKSHHWGTTKLQAFLQQFEDPIAMGDMVMGDLKKMVKTTQPVVPQAEIHLVVARVAAPPLPPPAEPVCGHQEINMGTETPQSVDLQRRAETLVFDLVRVSGVKNVSAAFRYEVGKNLVRFAQTSEEACRIARDTLDRKMLQLRREEEWDKKLIDLNRFIRRFPSIFVNMKCRQYSWVLEDPEDPENLSLPDPVAAPDHEEPPMMGLPSPAPAGAPENEEPPVMALPSPAAAQDHEEPPVMALPSHTPAAAQKAVKRRLQTFAKKHSFRAYATAQNVASSSLPLICCRKRQLHSTSQQYNEDEVEGTEVTAKKPRLNVTTNNAIAQHSSPNSVTAQHVDPPSSPLIFSRKRQIPSTSQQNNGLSVEKTEVTAKKLVHSARAQCSSPYVRPAPAQLVPPEAQAPCDTRNRTRLTRTCRCPSPTSQQNNADPTERMEIQKNSVAQQYSSHHNPHAQHMPPPLIRACKRRAPTSEQALSSAEMGGIRKKTKLSVIFLKKMRRGATTPT